MSFGEKKKTINAGTNKQQWKNAEIPSGGSIQCNVVGASNAHRRLALLNVSLPQCCALCVQGYFENKRKPYDNCEEPKKLSY